MRKSKIVFAVVLVLILLIGCTSQSELIEPHRVLEAGAEDILDDGESICLRFSMN